MASTYVNDLRLNEMATGDQSGSWGTVTNTNLELIAEAFSYSAEAITTNADAHTTTIADGATDPGRSMFLKYTGTLDSACTITIGPNTVSKLWFIENATSGSQNIIIKQGSGATVTIASGKTKVIYSDGVGSGAKMVDAFAALDVGSVSVDNITIDGNEIDVSSGDLTLDVAGEIILDADSNGVVRINDAGSNFGALFKNGTTFTFKSEIADYDMVFSGNDGGSTINALTLDMSSSGRATFNNNVVVTDNNSLVAGSGDDLQITYDGTNGEIDVSSGNLTLDVAGDIFLDAAGGDIRFTGGGTQFAKISNTTGNMIVESFTSNADILFQGNDGGANITALTLDMSDAGTAIFNHDAQFPDGAQVRLGADNDLKLHLSGTTAIFGAQNGDMLLDSAGDINLDAGGTDIYLKTQGNSWGHFMTTSNNFYIASTINDGDIIFQGVDGGSGITALTLDMSQDGTATFNGDVNAPNFNTTSDATLKTNVETLTGSLDAVKSLRGVSFDWIKNGGSEVGVIAQEVEDVLPDVVNTNEDGIKSVKYGNIVAVLIEAMKEQQAQIDELKTQLNS